MDQLAKSVRLNIETTKARLLESHGLANIEQACRDRIEGLRISFPRKLKDLRALAKACGVGPQEIVMFEAPLPRKPPAECTGFLATGSASKGGVTINAKVRELDARYIQGITARSRTVLEPAAKRHKHFPANCLREAYSFVGCRTLGTWGVAMGMNEFGVSVGDHTSFGKDRLHPDTGLESNDVCRLALEGARTAEEGARLVRELVEGHGHSREADILRRRPKGGLDRRGDLGAVRRDQGMRRRGRQGQRIHDRLRLGFRDRRPDSLRPQVGSVGRERQVQLRSELFKAVSVGE